MSTRLPMDREGLTARHCHVHLDAAVLNLEAVNRALAASSSWSASTLAREVRKALGEARSAQKTATSWWEDWKSKSGGQVDAFQAAPRAAHDFGGEDGGYRCLRCGTTVDDALDQPCRGVT